MKVGGDTDTIEAMTVAAVTALHGVGHISDPWWNDLENKDKGRDYIIELGEKLARISSKEGKE